jgi:hypothetical protein
MTAAEDFRHQRFATQRMNGEWFNLTADQVTWLVSLDSLEPDTIQLLSAQ